MKRLLLALCAASTLVAAPKTISYQGVLTDHNGMPKADGSYEITYALYSDTAVGAPFLWKSTSQTAAIGGLFNAILGSETPLEGIDFSEQYYLGIQVGADPEMVPRIALSGSGYAIRASVADSAVASAKAVEATHAVAADSAGTAAVALSVDGAAVALQTITAGHLAEGFVAPKATHADSSDRAAHAATAGVALSVDGAAVAQNSITPGHLAENFVAPKATHADSSDRAAHATTAGTAAALAPNTISTGHLTENFVAPKATHADSSNRAGHAATAGTATVATTANKVAAGSIGNSSFADTAKVPYAGTADVATSVPGVIHDGVVTTAKVQAKDNSGLSLVNAEGNGIHIDSIGETSIHRNNLRFIDTRNAEVGLFSTGISFNDYNGEAGYIRLNHNGYTGASARSLEIGVNNTHVLALNDKGKVGIGTSTPNASLTVKVPNEVITFGKDPELSFGSASGTALPAIYATSTNDKYGFFLATKNTVHDGFSEAAFVLQARNKDEDTVTTGNLFQIRNLDETKLNITHDGTVEVIGDLKVSGNVITNSVNGGSQVQTTAALTQNTTYYLPLVRSDEIVEYYIRSAASARHTTMKITLTTTYGNGTLTGQVTQYIPPTGAAIRKISVLYGSTYDRACLALEMGTTVKNTDGTQQKHGVKVIVKSPFNNLLEEISLSTEIPTGIARNDENGNPIYVNLSKTLPLDISSMNGSFELNW